MEREDFDVQVDQIGHAMRLRRQNVELSIQSVANALGVDRRTVSRAETNPEKLKVGNLIKLFHLYGIDFSQRVAISDAEIMDMGNERLKELEKAR